MDCFIKKIFLDKIDEQVHRQFVRFGKGKYERRAVLSLNKIGKIKLKGSFEYANDFVNFVSELGSFEGKFSGIILSKEKLNLDNKKLKQGRYIYEVENLSNEKIKEISDKAYYMLLDFSGGIELKIKKKLPKPGKSGKSKLDDKFCVLELGLEYYEKIKEAFFWDIEGRKIKVEHSYIINELEIPKDEKDFKLIRLNARRKGKIIRKLEIDGRVEIKEKEFEV